MGDQPSGPTTAPCAAMAVCDGHGIAEGALARLCIIKVTALREWLRRGLRDELRDKLKEWKKFTRRLLLQE